MKFSHFFPIVFLAVLIACTANTPPTDQAKQEPIAANLTPTTGYSDIYPAVTIAPIPSIESPKLKTRCLDVAAQTSDGFSSTGVVILDRVNDGGPQKGSTLLLDMATGNTTRIDADGEGQMNQIVAPNKKLMAYESILTAEGDILKDELVIADATGQRLKGIPWEEEWTFMPGWLDQEHLIINLSSLDSQENNGHKPASMLVLNSRTGERRILKPDFPGLLNASLSTSLYWKGWSGVVYDPTVTLAVYPRPVQNDDSMNTYVIWDMSKQKLVASLEDIFIANSYDPYPMPQWSPDGSQFVFRGVTHTSDGIRFELYQVKRSGETKQLTWLSPVYLVQDSNLSWSPNSRYIAIFLNSWGGYDEKQARVAVIDTETLEVTDYCISITYSGEGYGGRDPSPAVWSPDSKQFLVVDWYERDHQRLILIDIEKKMAVEIPENMEPMGWMATP